MKMNIDYFGQDTVIRALVAAANELATDPADLSNRANFEGVMRDLEEERSTPGHVTLDHHNGRVLELTDEVEALEEENEKLVEKHEKLETWLFRANSALIQLSALLGVEDADGPEELIKEPYALVESVRRAMAE
jgi:hypothetical protein